MPASRTAVRLRAYVAVLVAGTLVPVLLALVPTTVAVVVAVTAATYTARRIFPGHRRRRPV